MINFKNKTILITGGTGSFGSGFINYVIKNNIFFKKIIILSRDEYKQDILEKQIPKEYKKKIVNIYQPKLSIIEKQKDFTYAIKKHPSTKYSLSPTVFFLDLFKFFYTFKSPLFQKKQNSQINQLLQQMV